MKILLVGNMMGCIYKCLAKGRKGSLNTVFCSRRMDFSFDACRKASGSRLNQKQLLMLKMKYKEAHEVHIKALGLYLGQYGQTLGEISQWKLFLFLFFFSFG